MSNEEAVKKATEHRWSDDDVSFKYVDVNGANEPVIVLEIEDTDGDIDDPITSTLAQFSESDIVVMAEALGFTITKPAMVSNEAVKQEIDNQITNFDGYSASTIEESQKIIDLLGGELKVEVGMNPIKVYYYITLLSIKQAI